MDPPDIFKSGLFSNTVSKVKLVHIFYSQGEKFAGSLAVSFIEEMERQCGVKLVMFMGFVGKKGTLKYSS